MMKVITRQKPDVGHDYYINAQGIFVLSVTKDTPPEGVAEELAGLGPCTVAPTEVEPPAGGPWRFVNGDWVEVPKTYKQARQEEYREKLGPVPDQIDVLYKGLSLLIPDLIKAGVVTVETARALTPDKDADANTPAGWLGKYGDIKARHPKS